MTRNLKLIVLNVLFTLLLVTQIATAEDVVTLDPIQEVKADVTVGALVPSDVSEVYSSIWTNVDQALSDLEQGIVVTVELKDEDDLPLPDLPVVLTSNRGDIDNITVIDSQNNPTGEEIARTDTVGRAYFRVTSAVAGEATLTALADNLVVLPIVTNPSVEVTFLPLPFPENITISIEVPSIITPDKKVTIFKPSEKIITKEGVDKDADKSKLVNMGAEIIVPFWVLAFILILGSISPALLLIVLVLLRRIRKINAKELKTLEKEEVVIEKEEQILEKQEKIVEELAEDKIKDKLPPNKA